MSDDLVEDGPPRDYAVAGGGFDLPLPLSVNGVMLAELRERDLDGGGLGDGADNCPAFANPDQIDADLDGRGAACDCNDGEASAWAVPGQARTLL